MKQLELFEPSSWADFKEYWIIEKDYIHISDMIEDLWDTPDELIQYLHSLLLETRNGTRKGFPPEHAACILNLIEIRKKLLNNEFEKD